MHKPSCQESSGNSYFAAAAQGFFPQRIRASIQYLRLFYDQTEVDQIPSRSEEFYIRRRICRIEQWSIHPEHLLTPQKQPDPQVRRS